MLPSFALVWPCSFSCDKSVFGWKTSATRSRAICCRHLSKLKISLICKLRKLDRLGIRIKLPERWLFMVWRDIYCISAVLAPTVTDLRLCIYFRVRWKPTMYCEMNTGLLCCIYGVYAVAPIVYKATNPYPIKSHKHTQRQISKPESTISGDSFHGLSFSS